MQTTFKSVLATAAVATAFLAGPAMAQTNQGAGFSRNGPAAMESGKPGTGSTHRSGTVGSSVGGSMGAKSTVAPSGMAPRTNDAREQRMNSDTDVRRGSKPDGTQ